MTEIEKKEMVDRLEKAPHKSKKFVSWLLTQILLCGMSIIALWKQPDLGWPLALFMSLIVVTMGMTTMWYLGKQAAADIAIRTYEVFGKKQD